MNAHRDSPVPIPAFCLGCVFIFLCPENCAIFPSLNRMVHNAKPDGLHRSVARHVCEMTILSLVVIILLLL